MILIDYNGVAISSLMINMKLEAGMDENMMRHLILNNIRHAKNKFGQTYGKITICCDSGNNWRKKTSPYYKAHRKIYRDADTTINWGDVYNVLDKLRNEFAEEFGYDVFKIDTLEADDIISVLALKYDGPHIVISNDKDFFQLQTKKDVDIYSPMKSQKLKCQNPREFLIEHIIKGDKGDGVPNILSPLDTFVSGKRQKTIRSAKLNEWIKTDPAKAFDQETLARYEQNKTLISLIDLPEFVVEKITNEYDNKPERQRKNILGYFIKHNLRNMIDRIEDF